MKSKKSNSAKINNNLFTLIMVVIGLVGVYALSRSVIFEDNYRNGIHLSENCAVIYKNKKTSDITNCMEGAFAQLDSQHNQAQIFEVIGTAMVSVAVVSTFTVLQSKNRLK